jgi:hypothetical protein
LPKLQKIIALKRGREIVVVFKRAPTRFRGGKIAKDLNFVDATVRARLCVFASDGPYRQIHRSMPCSEGVIGRV